MTTGRGAKPSMGGLAALLLLAAPLLPEPAAADGNWKTSSAVWKQMDTCTRNARKQFPDYTADANAKREVARQKCLRAGNLPSDEPEAQQPPQPPAPR
jgi:hypothetical protein